MTTIRLHPDRDAELLRDLEDNIARAFRDGNWFEVEVDARRSVHATTVTIAAVRATEAAWRIGDDEDDRAGERF